MKQLLALALFLTLGSASALAQKVEAQSPSDKNDSPTDVVAREAADKLSTKYSLNADQAKEMYTVQQRKQRNLGQIAALEASNRSLYLSKLESLQKGTLASIRRILRTKEQVDLYQKTQAEVRTQRAAKRKELTGKNLSKEDMQAAVLEIYAE